MKKLTDEQKKKLHAIGQKIGVILMALALIAIWFGIGFLFGRKSASKAVKARADDIESYDFVYLPINFTYNLVYHMTSPVHLYSRVGYRVAPTDKYIILPKGSTDFGIGDFGSTLTGLPNESLAQMVNGTLSCYTSVSTVMNDGTPCDYVGQSYVSCAPQSGDIDFNNFGAYDLVSVSLVTDHRDTPQEYFTYPYQSRTCYYKCLYSSSNPGQVGTYEIDFILYCSNFIAENQPSMNFTFAYDVPNDIETFMSFNYGTFSNGYNVGIRASNPQVFEQGRLYGYDEGYIRGVEATITDSNTLKGAMTTVIETPVNIFRTIFDWEFLGFNLFGVFTAMFTIIFVVWVFKKVI